MNHIKDSINNSDGIVILAGAGMGVDAGIPDFRGKSGLWTAEKDNFMKFSSGAAFHERSLEAWNFYITRLLKHKKLPPHRGYYDLKKLLDDLNKDVFVVTSNVDGHFKKALYREDKIYEIHGNLEYIQCSNRCHNALYPMPEFTESLNTLDGAPKCPKCNGLMRPAVMMFNDPWFVMNLVEEQSQKCIEWYSNKSNVFGIEIGAGTAVPSIRIHGRELTQALLRINPYEFTVNRPQDIAINSTALDGIDALIKIMAQ